MEEKKGLAGFDLDLVKGAIHTIMNSSFLLSKGNAYWVAEFAFLRPLDAFYVSLGR